jgi:hypothetical protein
VGIPCGGRISREVHMLGGATAVSETPIRPQSLIASVTAADFNRSAGELYSAIVDHGYLLGRPFSEAGDAPLVISCLAQVLFGLRLTPGMTIVNFGSGPRWATRVLTQLGLHAIAVDVSETALQFGRELFAKNPTHNSGSGALSAAAPTPPAGPTTPTPRSRCGCFRRVQMRVQVYRATPPLHHADRPRLRVRKPSEPGLACGRDYGGLRPAPTVALLCKRRAPCVEPA